MHKYTHVRMDWYDFIRQISFVRLEKLHKNQDY